MNQNSGKLALALVSLMGVWVLVYWLAPGAPKVTFAEQVTQQPIEEPIESSEVKPVPMVERPSRVERPINAEASTPDRFEVPAGGGVIAPEFREHTVAQGETFETIGAKYYGKRGMGSVIARANPFVDPRRLKPGRVLRVPKDPSNIQGVEVLPAGERDQFVIVKSGDTLSSIAKSVYGTVTMADAIFEANRDQLTSPDSLSLGQRLRLPKGPT